VFTNQEVLEKSGKKKLDKNKTKVIGFMTYGTLVSTIPHCTLWQSLSCF